MVDGQDYAKMRDELLRAVQHICRQCAEPKVPGGNVDVSDPEQCPCRCERTRGILGSVKGLRSPGEGG